jgi:hypothetical protein
MIKQLQHRGTAIACFLMVAMTVLLLPSDAYAPPGRTRPSHTVKRPVQPVIQPKPIESRQRSVRRPYRLFIQPKPIESWSQRLPVWVLPRQEPNLEEILKPLDR